MRRRNSEEEVEEEEDVEEALRMLINSVKVRNPGDLQTLHVMGSILEMLQSDYGMPGLDTQRLNEALKDFMAGFCDAIIMDQDHLILL